MEVILKQDMQPLGFKDDIVSVKPGYGRNYLIPQGIADLATPSAKKMHAETLKQRAKKQEKLKAELKKIKDAKEVMEEYIITYLDKNDADFLNIGKEKLRVEEKKSQSAIKMEYIEECLVDGFKKYVIDIF